MATVKMTILPNQKPSKEQIEEIREAAKYPVVPDEDCPELTEEQLERFAALARQKRASRRKELISIRVSPDTLQKAKKLGEGYTGVLSRLLDLAINDPELVKKCL